MKICYRVLQTRWPGAQEWRNWGFVYRQGDDPSAPLSLHHNLDEFQEVVQPALRRMRGLSPSLEEADVILEGVNDLYRFDEPICEHVADGPESAIVNAIEARILSLERMKRHEAAEADIRIFTGRANRPLAQAVAHQLGSPLSALTTRSFPDTEVYVTIDEVVRKADVFVIQPCTAPVNEHLMELLLIVDVLRRSSAAQITAIIPYYPYARQERMAQGREAVSARVVATMLETIGVDRIIYIDIHSEATQGFFTLPVDRLQAYPILSDYFRDKPYLKDAVIVSPDVGRARLAGLYAEALEIPMVLMHKRRQPGGQVETTHVVGDVKNKIPILIDDIIASGSVLTQVPELLKQGARPEMHVAITHPVLLPSALERLDADWLAELVVTDTVLVPPPKQHPKLHILSVAPMLAYAIRGIHRGTSISPLWRSDAPRMLGFYDEI